MPGGIRLKPPLLLWIPSFHIAQINDAANRVANGLKAIGIKPGDKVALSCLNLPDFPIIYFGILKAGAVVVPLNVLLKKDEIEYHLHDSEAKAYFCFTGTPDLPMGEMGYAAFNAVKECEHFFMIMPAPGMPSSIEGTKTLGDLVEGQSPLFDMHQSNAEDTCVIIYTSGTTGRPKGAELTHSNLLFNAILSSDLRDSKAEDVGLNRFAPVSYFWNDGDDECGHLQREFWYFTHPFQC